MTVCSFNSCKILHWSPSVNTVLSFLPELCQFPTIQLVDQLPSCQFPTWSYPKPGGGDHPCLHMQQHSRPWEGRGERRRWVVRPIPCTVKSIICLVNNLPLWALWNTIASILWTSVLRALKGHIIKKCFQWNEAISTTRLPANFKMHFQLRLCWSGPQEY